MKKENNNDFKEIKESLLLFTKALCSHSEEEWDKAIRSVEAFEDEELYFRVCSETIIKKDNSKEDDYFHLLIKSLDSITHVHIDASGNHLRGHIHIAIKTNNHAVSIAIDDGSVLAGGKDISQWKINKIAQWVIDNQAVLGKMWRCMNPWGNSTDAERRKSKLTDF